MLIFYQLFLFIERILLFFFQARETNQNIPSGFFFSIENLFSGTARSGCIAFESDERAWLYALAQSKIKVRFNRFFSVRAEIM
jgi:hypothetical protein